MQIHNTVYLYVYVHIHTYESLLDCYSLLKSFQSELCLATLINVTSAPTSLSPIVNAQLLS